MNNQSSNSGFIEISLLHSQHLSSVKNRRVKIVLKIAAAEASCCFILIFGIIDEVEMYGTNNKHSLDLSEHKKQRCLNFRNFAHFFNNYIIRTEYSIEITDPQVSVQNMELLMRRNKTIKQNFSAVKNNQCPNSGFPETYLLPPEHHSSVQYRCVKIVMTFVATE